VEQQEIVGTRDRQEIGGTGDSQAISGTGDSQAISGTGYNQAIRGTGEDSVAIAWGLAGKAKGAMGCYIALAEWIKTDNKYVLKYAKMTKVDGKKIKADTFYILKNGKFVKAK
ncbi:MAG: hypothetical protein WC310_05925, partial [Patescibacteria group bacterium]